MRNSAITINIYTDQGLKETMHRNNIQTFFRTITHGFEQFNFYMQRILKGMSDAAPKILQRTILPTIPQGFNKAAPCPLQLQAPWDFHGNSPTHH